jgi:hypothetical protein
MIVQDMEHNNSSLVWLSYVPQCLHLVDFTMLLQSLLHLDMDHLLLGLQDGRTGI